MWSGRGGEIIPVTSSHEKLKFSNIYSDWNPMRMYAAFFFSSGARISGSAAISREMVSFSATGNYVACKKYRQNSELSIFGINLNNNLVRSV